MKDFLIFLKLFSFAAAILPPPPPTPKIIQEAHLLTMKLLILQKIIQKLI